MKLRYLFRQKCSIFIFGVLGANIVHELITDKACFTFDYEAVFYVNFKILFKLFFTFVNLKYKGTLFSMRDLYNLSCLYAIKPKIVLTFIDNSKAFYFLSKNYSCSRFIGIQNGVRAFTSWGENRKVDSMDFVSIDDYFCFGFYVLYTFFVVFFCYFFFSKKTKNQIKKKEKNN